MSPWGAETIEKEGCYKMIADLKRSITVLAFAYNEEKRLPAFLAAVAKLGRVVVIDNFSSDNTVAIARWYKADVFSFRNAGYAEHPEVAKFALGKVESEWVYWGRIDEIPPTQLVDRLTAIAHGDNAEAVYIARMNILFGAPVMTWGADHQLIFFKKASIDMERAALFEHGVIKSGSRIIKMPHTEALSLWHFSSYDVRSYTNTNNRYSTITADDICSKRRHEYSVSPEKSKRLLKTLVAKMQTSGRLEYLRICILPIMRFGWHYFVRGGWKSKGRGFVTSYLMMMEQMLTELKVWERNNGFELDAVNARNEKYKADLAFGRVPTVEK